MKRCLSYIVKDWIDLYDVKWILVKIRRMQLLVTNELNAIFRLQQSYYFFPYRIGQVTQIIIFATFCVDCIYFKMYFIMLCTVISTTNDIV